jgi:hypothetical protein
VFESKDRTCNKWLSEFVSKSDAPLEALIKISIESGTTIFFRPFRFPKVYFLLIENTKSCKLPFLPYNEPCPPAKRSRISPPEPVAAPLKGSTVVGNYVFLLLGNNRIKFCYLIKIRFVCAFDKLLYRGPFTKATLSLYAETISLGFSNDVFLIILNKEDSFPHHQ